MFRGTNIATIIWINFMILICALVGTMGYFWVHQEKERLHVETRKMEDDHLLAQKLFIEREVREVIDFIEFKRSQLEDRMKKNLQARVREARDMAWHLHNQFKDTKPDQEIRTIVKEALRPIRFNDGRGYFFVSALDGTAQLSPEKPELEGSNVLATKDPNSRAVAKDMIAIAHDSGEGFYQYTWTKPNIPRQDFPKLAYVARFEPFNWVIGTGAYLDDEEQEIKQEVLERVDKIRFGEDGYVFVFQFDGHYLSHLDKKYIGQYLLDIKDPVGFKVNRELLRLSQESTGGFLQYVWYKPSLRANVRKISYAKAFKDWQWVIGTGVYLDDIEQTIAANHALAGARIRRQIRLIIIVSAAAIGVALVFARNFAKKVQGEVDIFSHFFEKAATSHETIDKTKVSIGEFRRLTDHANRMVADRRTWEEDLAHEKQRFQTLVEQAPFGIIAIGSDGTVNYTNPTFERLFGYSRADLPDDKTWFALAFPDSNYREAAVSAWKEELGTLGPGKESSGTYTVRCKDDSEKIIHFRHVKLDAGEHLFTAGDSTERKLLEDRLRQAAKMEAIGQLAGGVAHDFNNLLTAIIGYSDVLLSQNQSDKGFHDKLAQIRRAADRAAGLTRQLLAFSRKQVLDVKNIDLNDLVNDLGQILDRLLGEQIRLETHMARDLSAVRCDPGQLEQVILNLAVNARDAMPSGGTISIETANVILDKEYCRTRQEVVPGPHVMLVFSDTGIGMDQHTRARIFEPFFTTKDKETGTGLGLAMVYGIIKQHKGHVAVYSEPGRGTTFKVYLPCVDEQAEHLWNEDSGTKGPSGHETVLLVEDEDIVRDLSREVLEMHGYRVLEASTPGQALEICRGHEDWIDLLLTDVVLPEMDGRTLFHRLTELKEGLKVLYVSGYTENYIVHHGVLDPGVHFLAKPFTVEGLAVKVREVLDSD